MPRQIESESVTACNARPPEDHPFHGTLVACHLPCEHVEIGDPHSWDIDAMAAKHARLMRGITRLRECFPDRKIVRFEPQHPHAYTVWEVNEQGAKTSGPYRMWEEPEGPWVIVTHDDDRQYAIWKSTGEVFQIINGRVREDPL